MSSTITPAARQTTAREGFTPPAAAPRIEKRQRLVSLDVFRGMTVAGMLLVNNPGSWEAIYPPLEHASWHGWTPTDLIFPFFLFIAGITTHISLSGRIARGDDEGAIVRQILRRGALIFLFGLILAAFPFYQWGSIREIANPGVWDRIVYRAAHLRFLGVLQRIAIAYTFAALLTLRTTLRQQIAILVSLLVGYWIVMTALPVPDTGYYGLHVLDKPGMTMDAWLDRTILGVPHLWSGGGGVRDPEGLLSTVPAIGTAMLGIFAGRWIASERSLAERLNGLFAVGALGMMLGLVWNWVFPINKSLWTSSYVLLAGGLACVALATCMWVIDVHGMRGAWTRFFVVYGTNPMIAFLGSGLMARGIDSMWHVQYQGRTTSMGDAVYQTLFASWLSPVNSSLAFAITFVLFWYAILYALYRKNIILKV